MYALITVLVLIAAVALTAQAAPPPGMLPASSGPWRLAETTTFDRSSLFSFIDGGAEVYLAYAFRRVWVGTYRAPERPGIAVEVYDMNESDDAFGVLSVDPSGEHVAVGSLARYGAGLLRFCKGSWFVRVLAERETPETRAAVLDLGKHVASAIHTQAPPPALLRALPVEGMLPDSATYFHTQITLNQLSYLGEGNLLGLGPEVQAVTARYRAGKSTPRLIVVKYPHPDLARTARGRFVSRYLHARSTTPDPVIRKAEGKAYAGALARPPHLLLVLDAPTAAAARALLTRAR